MPLRDFERVRERIEIHLEIRHLAQIIAGGLALLALAFGAGWWAASSQQLVIAQQQSTHVQIAPFPAPPPGLAARRQPVLPRAVNPRRAARPKLARVLEAMVREQPLSSAVAAEHREQAGRSESAESPFEHVARDRAATAPAAPPSPAIRFKHIHSGATVNARPDSPEANRGEGWPELATIPAELVQSQPLRPLALSSSIDVTRLVRIEPASLGLTGLVGPDGAAIATPVVVGGVTTEPPVAAPLQAADAMELKRWLAQETQREQDRLAAERAEQERVAAEAARLQVQQAAERAAAKPQAAAPDLIFFVQVKAFRNQPEARDFAKLLKDRGHKPLVSRITVPDRGEFHRVRIGPYTTIESARAAQRSFQAREPYETMVMSR